MVVGWCLNEAVAHPVELTRTFGIRCIRCSWLRVHIYLILICLRDLHKLLTVVVMTTFDRGKERVIVTPTRRAFPYGPRF